MVEDSEKTEYEGSIGETDDIVTPGRPSDEITLVEITRLFDLFDYTLDLSVKPESNTKTNILYGDNGSGKTTLLALIYCALSQNHNEGNRTKLARTPFRTMRIGLKSGRSILVTKTQTLVGSYTFEIFYNHSQISSTVVTTDEELSVKLSNNPDISDISKVLSEVSPKLLFITDDRRYYTTLPHITRFRDRHNDRTLRQVSPDTLDFDLTIARETYVFEEKAIRSLSTSVSELARLIRDVYRSQLYRAESSGQRSANSIYLSVIKAISSEESDPLLPGTRDALLASLKKLEPYTAQAVEVGAIQEIPFDDFARAIANASAEQAQAIGQVLIPYLNGLEARVDAIHETVSRLSNFVAELNRFYHNKEFSFNLARGFRVRDAKGRRMSLDWLSSGERQLFMVLGTVFMAQDPGAVILIDEPELSLNVKWQREFIPALSALNSGSLSQYFLATHSLEIMSGHERNIVPLNWVARS